jgi:tetratricopeptide (TPR) repeat protein
MHSPVLCGQIDSLMKLLAGNLIDSTRCEALMLAGQHYSRNNPDSALFYWMQAKILAEKAMTNSPEGSAVRRTYGRILSDALTNLGYLSNEKGDFQIALAYFDRGIEIQKRNRDSIGLAYSYNNLSQAFKNLGDYKKALEYCYRSVRLRDALRDKTGALESYINLGGLYKSLDDFDKAADCYRKAFELTEGAGNSRGAASALNHMGEIALQAGKIAEAEDYYKRALQLNESMNDRKGISNSLASLGFLYEKKSDLKASLNYYLKSLALREAIGDRKGQVSALNIIGRIHFESGNLNQALSYCRASMKLAREHGNPSYIFKTAKNLYKIYKAKGNHKDALEMFGLYVGLQDSLTNAETKKEGLKKQFQYEYEKKAAADSVKNTEMQKVKDAQLTAQSAKLKQERTQFWFLVCGLACVVGGLSFVVHRFRITQKQKKIIEAQKIQVDTAFEKLHEKNKEVLDSIYYARRIQRALLTPEGYIHRTLARLSR